MELINTLNQVYQRQEKIPDVSVSSLANHLQDWFYKYPEYPYLHPCIIDAQAALVCQADLSQLAPAAYSELLKICQQHNVYLKQDARSADLHIAANRRTQTAVVLGFCLGILSAPSLARDRNFDGFNQKQQVSTQLLSKSGHISAQHMQKNGKKVISLRHIRPPSAEQVLEAYKQKKNLQAVDAQAEYKIHRFLKQAYQYQPGDPVGIKTDLQKIAAYYAKFPQVVELIEELSQKKVLLKYKKSNWQAQALGSQYAVDQVTVYFDTRIGAQLWLHQECHGNPACHVTPADALLHELLHAKLMIVDSDEFIRQGGMKPSLYLFDHEKEVIAEENALYAQMTEQDGLLRPIRKRHSGALHYASCALCLPNK